MPARITMMTDELTDTNPAPGVITTKPATMPEQNPSTLGFPRAIHSTRAQTKPAVAAASVVVAKALDAIASAPSAEPALNPYQPTQSMPVPTIQSTMECGGMASLPN